MSVSENDRHVENLLHALDGEDDLDEARVVVVEGAERDLAVGAAELGQCLVCQGRSALPGHIQPGGRANAIHARWIAQWLVVGRLHVAGGIDGFADVILVVAWVNVVSDDVAIRVGKAEPALVTAAGAVEAEVAVFPADGHEHGGEVAEDLDFVAELLHHVLEEDKGARGDGQRVGNAAQNLVPLCHGQRRGHAAVDDPRPVNALAAQQIDHLLAPLAQANAAQGQVGMSLRPGRARCAPRDRRPSHAGSRARTDGRS